MPQFSHYIGVDYSGAETPTSSLKGLRAYSATPGAGPVEVLPPPSPRKYWTRRGLAERLVGELVKDEPTIVGIDHAFSFPLAYFKKYGLAHDWPAFLDHFHQHWPTDRDHTYVCFIREDFDASDTPPTGSSKWRRLTEIKVGAKSPFHFDVPGSVANSTHAGLPWLRYIRNNTKVHFWPFDGWTPPAGKSVIAEVYPRLWSKDYPKEDRTQDQHDAYSVAATLRQADKDGTLAKWFASDLAPNTKAAAGIEGWILGVS